MKAGQLFRELSRESWWASQSVKMRWIAARYYAGVESLLDLRARTKRRPVFRDHFQPPELTEAEARAIIQLR